MGASCSQLMADVRDLAMHEPHKALGTLVCAAVFYQCARGILASPVYTAICFAYVGYRLYQWDTRRPQLNYVAVEQAPKGRAEDNNTADQRLVARYNEHLALVAIIAIGALVVVYLQGRTPQPQRLLLTWREPRKLKKVETGAQIRSFTIYLPAFITELLRQRTSPSHQLRSTTHEPTKPKKVENGVKSRSITITDLIVLVTEHLRERTPRSHLLQLPWHEPSHTPKKPEDDEQLGSVNISDLRVLVTKCLQERTPRSHLFQLPWYEPKKPKKPENTVSYSLAELLFLRRNILKWIVFEAPQTWTPLLTWRPNSEDILWDLEPISHEHNLYHLLVTHVQPVWPHEEDEVGDYNPRSRLLAARGKSPFPKIKLPKIRHTLYGFKRLPNRIFWESVYHSVQGAARINKTTYTEFNVNVLLHVAARVLDVTDTTEALEYLKPVPTVPQIQQRMDDDDLESDEWEYIEDSSFIELDVVQSMFKYPVDSAQAPSPLMFGTLFRLQDGFWLDNKCMPSDEEFQDLIRTAHAIDKMYIGKALANLEANNWRAEQDSIMDWIRKRDVDYEYFEADEDGEDPEAVDSSSAAEEDDDEDEDDFRIPLSIDQFLEPSADGGDEPTSKLHSYITQTKVNSIFSWINKIAVEEDAVITGIYPCYTTYPGEVVVNNVTECFQQLLVYRSRLQTLPEALHIYLPLGSSLAPRLLKVLGDPDKWKSISRIRGDVQQFGLKEERSFVCKRSNSHIQMADLDGRSGSSTETPSPSGGSTESTSNTSGSSNSGLNNIPTVPLKPSPRFIVTPRGSPIKANPDSNREVQNNRPTAVQEPNSSQTNRRRGNGTFERRGRVTVGQPGAHTPRGSVYYGPVAPKTPPYWPLYPERTSTPTPQYIRLIVSPNIHRASMHGSGVEDPFIDANTQPTFRPVVDHRGTLYANNYAGPSRNANTQFPSSSQDWDRDDHDDAWAANATSIVADLTGDTVSPMTASAFGHY